MKKEGLFFAISILMISLTIIFVGAVGGGGGGGGGSSGGGSSGGGGGDTFAFSDVGCFDDGSIRFTLSTRESITAINIETNKTFSVPGRYTAANEFISEEVTFNEKGNYSIRSRQGTIKYFECPGLKFSCKLVRIEDTYCRKTPEGITAGFKLINDSYEEGSLKFNFKLERILLTYSREEFSTELEDLKIEQSENELILTLPTDKNIENFEVVHQKCIGKEYIYGQATCLTSAQQEEEKIIPTQLKCGGLLNIKDRVRCRINIETESESEEYQNFFPEDCRTHPDSQACYNLYLAVSKCWDLPTNIERINCLKENVGVGKENNQKEINENLKTMIKLRFYHLEEKAEMLQEIGLLDKENLIDFVVLIEEKKKEFNQVKTKEEMKRIIQEVRDAWKDLVSGINGK